MLSFLNRVIDHFISLLLLRLFLQKHYVPENLFFYFVDDTKVSKPTPSSRILHPIADAYFHQSHLKWKQNYEHQSGCFIHFLQNQIFSIILFSVSKYFLSKYIIINQFYDTNKIFFLINYPI